MCLPDGTDCVSERATWAQTDSARGRLGHGREDDMGARVARAVRAATAHGGEAHRR